MRRLFIAVILSMGAVGTAYAGGATYANSPTPKVPGCAVSPSYHLVKGTGKIQREVVNKKMSYVATPGSVFSFSMNGKSTYLKCVKVSGLGYYTFMPIQAANH